MKPNDFIKGMNPPKGTVAIEFLKTIIDAASLSLTTEIKEDEKQCQEFFKNYYVKPNINGRVNGCLVNEALSSIEADILNFFISDSSKSTPYLFIDHAGRGKSTIIKYLAYYLYKKENELREKILPIYISLRSHEQKIREFRTVTELQLFICQLIKEKAFKIAKEYFFSFPEISLKWINDYYESSLQGYFSTKIINAAIKDPEEFLSNFSQKDSIKMNEFIVGLLCHYSINKVPIILFIDDADNFSIDVQRTIINFSTRVIPLGLRTLVAMRKSTWRTFQSDRRDNEPNISKEIIWSLDQLKLLLRKRLNNAKEIIALQSGRPNIKMDITQGELIDSFINIIASDQATDFLIRTSNYNLHSLMQKFSQIPSSWHFLISQDRFLLREHLITLSQKEHGVGLRNIFNYVFGYHKGVFLSSDEMARCGIMNCFCTRDEKHERYTFFCRLHLLVYLIENTEEGKSIPLRTICDNYRQVFGENLRLSGVFARTIYRLVQSGLIVTKSCRRYQTINEVHEHLDSDSVYISEAGLYYIQWLISRIDYLYFMKDDVDWPDRYGYHIEHVKITSLNNLRFKQTLKALYYLMWIEFDMLTEICDQINKPGGEQIAKIYVNLFSARKISKHKDQVLFTNHMLYEYQEHLARKIPNYRKEYADEFNEINRLLRKYKQIKDAFL